jgi:hypothetical protein
MEAVNLDASGGLEIAAESLAKRDWQSEKCGPSGTVSCDNGAAVVKSLCHNIPNICPNDNGDLFRIDYERMGESEVRK